MFVPALLVLEDGTKFLGKSVGVQGMVSGELVFNTSMTGYQEIITDPSYFGQIVVFTYPHIGNVGINDLDNESSKVQVKGIIVKNLSLIASSFRCRLSLSDYLIDHGVVAVSDIDTRKLTRLLRDKGVQHGRIIAERYFDSKDFNLLYPYKKIRQFSCNFSERVSTNIKYCWTEGSSNITNIVHTVSKNLIYHVVVYDFGVKRNIMRMLVDRGCYLTVIPPKTSVHEVLGMRPDGIFLTNGPGDPLSCSYIISSIKIFLEANIPLFGICLGYQLLALANGCKTIKMKFGHHGSNHPVKDLLSNKIIMTTQNHCFAVDAKTLPSTVKMTHISLFDGTLQGIHCNDKPAFGFQGHPEASPGPHDASSLFDHFIDLINGYRVEQ